MQTNYATTATSTMTLTWTLTLTTQPRQTRTCSGYSGGCNVPVLRTASTTPTPCMWIVPSCDRWQHLRCLRHATNPSPRRASSSSPTRRVRCTCTVDAAALWLKRRPPQRRQRRSTYTNVYPTHRSTRRTWATTRATARGRSTTTSPSCQRQVGGANVTSSSSSCSSSRSNRSH